MNKIHSSIEQVIRSCISHIASKTEYDADIMLGLASQFLHNERQPSRRCEAIVLSGNQCTNSAGDNQYCKKHVHFDATRTSIRIQCAATTSVGCRCIRDAKAGGELCGVHIGKQVREQRRALITPCLYYDEPDDQFIFCKNPTIEGQWCCKLHRHLHNNYCSTFKYNNLKSYIDAKEKGAPVNQLLEERLKHKTD